MNMAKGPSLDKLPAKRRKAVTFSGKFVPLFWDDADGRCASVKRIKRRLQALREDAQADSVQKEMLCQRATFLALQLEAMERKAAEGETISSGVYNQGCNALLGLLRALGLASAKKSKRTSLKDYLQEEGTNE
jgi:hypothetical protein